MLNELVLYVPNKVVASNSYWHFILCDLSFWFCSQPVMDLWEQVRYMVDVPMISSNSVKESRTDYRTQAAFVQKGKEYLEQM